MPEPIFDSLTVAKTILEQLGGRRFIAMTGASLFAGTAKSLKFRIPRTNGINVVLIELNAMDEYELTFSRIHGTTHKIVEEVTGIYCDQLQEIFTQYTGLATHL